MIGFIPKKTKVVTDPFFRKISLEELSILKKQQKGNCGWFSHNDNWIGELKNKYHNVYQCQRCNRITLRSQGSGCDY